MTVPTARKRSVLEGDRDRPNSLKKDRLKARKRPSQQLEKASQKREIDRLKQLKKDSQSSSEKAS